MRFPVLRPIGLRLGIRWVQRRQRGTPVRGAGGRPVIVEPWVVLTRGGVGITGIGHRSILH